MVTDEEFAEIRGTRSYWAAIWLTRFNFIPVVLLFWLGLSGGGAGWSFLWLLLLVSVLTALELLRRSGAPFVGVGLFRGIRDPRMVRRILKDVFWLR